jgi:hypothetical protein
MTRMPKGAAEKGRDLFRGSRNLQNVKAEN